MKDKSTKRPKSDLMALFSAIASRDRSTASRLLAQSPALAEQALVIGATRQEANTYYFVEIAHYAYVGDTPLHIAAAAYARDITDELISRGASVHARNRAVPSHSTTRAMVFPVRALGIPMLNTLSSSS